MKALKALLEADHELNKYIRSELEYLSDKKIIHLQCNTGTDTISLENMGSNYNLYVKKLAEDLGIENINYIESNIMELMETHNEKYDVVFVSENAMGWLPNIKKWTKIIRHLLKDDGFFYIFESHPSFICNNLPELTIVNLTPASGRG